MLVAHVLSYLIDIPSLCTFLLLDRPNAMIGGDLVPGDKQVDQSSELVVELQVISIFDVVLYAIFSIGVDVGVEEVDVG